MCQRVFERSLAFDARFDNFFDFLETLEDPDASPENPEDVFRARVHLFGVSMPNQGSDVDFSFWQDDWEFRLIIYGGPSESTAYPDETILAEKRIVHP